MIVISKKLNLQEIQTFYTDVVSNYFKSLNNYWVFCTFKAEDLVNKNEVEYIKLHSRFFDCTIYISKDEDDFEKIINSMNKINIIDDYAFCNKEDDLNIVKIAQKYLFEHLNEKGEFHSFIEKQKKLANERGLVKGQNHVRKLFKNELNPI